MVNNKSHKNNVFDNEILNNEVFNNNQTHNNKDITNNSTANIMDNSTKTKSFNNPNSNTNLNQNSDINTNSNNNNSSNYKTDLNINLNTNPKTNNTNNPNTNNITNTNTDNNTNNPTTSVYSTHSFRPFNKAGFSLIEISIVILIISILGSAILSGRNVVRSTKVVSVSKESNTYELAISKFVRDYGYLPGDFPNAIITFCRGEDDTCTVNGNGDGFVGTDGSGPTDLESLNFFHHLYLAGLTSKKFTGAKSEISLSNINKNHYPFIDGVNGMFLYVSSDSINENGNRLNRLTYGSKGKDSKASGIPGWLAKQYDCKNDDCNPTTGLVIAANANTRGNLSFYYNNNPNNTIINPLTSTLLSFLINIEPDTTFQKLSTILPIIQPINLAYAENDECVVSNDYNTKSKKCILYQNIYSDDANYYDGYVDDDSFENTSNNTADPCTTEDLKEYNTEKMSFGGEPEQEGVKQISSGARLEGSCNTGYEQKNGAPYVTCNNGSWKLQNVSTCEAVECNNKDITLSNSNSDELKNSLETTTYDDTKEIICKNGYTKKTTTVIARCNANKGWDYNNSCEPVVCNKNNITSDINSNDLSNIKLISDNTTNVNEETEYNRAIDIDCEKGYTKNGTTIRLRCTNNDNSPEGKWELADTNKCEPVVCSTEEFNDESDKEVQDRNIQAYGSITDFEYNSSENLKCKENYANSDDINNINTITAKCISDETNTTTGKWNYIGKCVPVCDKSGLKQNNAYIFGDTIGKGKVEVGSIIEEGGSCNSNSYQQIEGQGVKAKCESDGRWNLSGCKEITCANSKLKVEHSTITFNTIEKDIASVGETADIECNEKDGYYSYDTEKQSYYYDEEGKIYNKPITAICTKSASWVHTGSCKPGCLDSDLENANNIRAVTINYDKIPDFTPMDDGVENGVNDGKLTVDCADNDWVNKYSYINSPSKSEIKCVDIETDESENDMYTIHEYKSTKWVVYKTREESGETHRNICCTESELSTTQSKYRIWLPTIIKPAFAAKLGVNFYCFPIKDPIAQKTYEEFYK